MSMPTRDVAFELLQEYTQNENLIKHALSVEAAMRHYARHFGEDEAAWGAVGLLHDFDYDRYPSLDDHPFKGAEILQAKGYDEWLVRAVLSHANHTGISRETLLEKALFAVDELCGLLTATALVRPSRRIADVEVSSVKKKMKDKAFARSVSRDDIRAGAEALGVPLDEHIAHVIEAMSGIAAQLGL